MNRILFIGIAIVGISLIGADRQANASVLNLSFVGKGCDGAKAKCCGRVNRDRCSGRAKRERCSGRIRFSGRTRCCGKAAPAKPAADAPPAPPAKDAKKA
jgi:hypothetical protein